MGDGLPLDTGFLVHNTRNYPLLTRLFAERSVGSTLGVSPMRAAYREAHTACMEPTYLTYVAQAQSGSLAGPPIEWPRLRRRRRRVRIALPSPAAALL